MVSWVVAPDAPKRRFADATLCWGHDKDPAPGRNRVTGSKRGKPASTAARPGCEPGGRRVHPLFLAGAASLVVAGFMMPHHPGRLVVLELDGPAIEAAGIEIKHEDGGDGELYPHVDGALELEVGGGNPSGTHGQRRAGGWMTELAWDGYFHARDLGGTPSTLSLHGFDGVGQDCARAPPAVPDRRGLGRRACVGPCLDSGPPLPLLRSVRAGVPRGCPTGLWGLLPL